MKNFIQILAILFFGFLIGCTDDTYDKPNSFSDVGFYTGLGQAPTLQIGIYNYLSFSDLSQGTIDHKWTINPGNYFLEGPIAARDSILDQFIINRGSTSSTDKTIHVLFEKSGNQEVTLYNTFKDSVAFRGYKNGEEYFLHSTKVADKWVIDTTFVVKVYDTIVPEIEVNQFDLPVDYKSKDTIFVEAGDNVEFVDNTTIGEPTGRYWFVKNTLPDGTIGTETVASSSEQTAKIVFKKLGHFTAGITATRNGQNIPGDSDQYIIPAPFKVIPSSKPFELFGNIAELEDETIQIPFNGEFAPFINQEEFFKVTVEGLDFEVASVEINADDATILDLILTEPIYRPDVILVSLLSGNSLTSTDTRTPVLFTDVQVKMHDVNLLPENIAGMETGMGWTAWEGGQGIPERSTEQAATGDYSYKLVMTPGMDWASAQGILPEAMVLDGSIKYTLSYKMFIDNSTTVRPNVGGMFLITNWGWQYWMDYKDVNLYPTGEWVTRTTDYQSGAGFTKFYLRFSSQAGTSNATVYFDDFYFVKKEVRP